MLLGTCQHFSNAYFIDYMAHQSSGMRGRSYGLHLVAGAISGLDFLDKIVRLDLRSIVRNVYTPYCINEFTLVASRPLR